MTARVLSSTGPHRPTKRPGLTMTPDEATALAERDTPLARWRRDLAAFQARQADKGSLCATPGVPGSSPACAGCTASCSPEPADVDPLEAALMEAGDHPAGGGA